LKTGEKAPIRKGIFSEKRTVCLWDEGEGNANTGGKPRLEVRRGGKSHLNSKSKKVV